MKSSQMLLLDNTCEMHKVFLKQDRVVLYMNSVTELVDDRLMNADWNDVKEMVEMLEPFEKLSVLSQSRGTLWVLICSSSRNDP
jgi:hypothetical protein